MIVVFTLIMVLKLEFAYAHLKNLGPVYTNWTSEEVMVFSMVAGGSRTKLSKYPFNVKVLNFGSLCGGSIITVKHVLTAAHCFEYNDHIGDMQVISNSEGVFSVGAIFHDIWDFKIHEGYGVGSTFANDVAVLIIHGQFTYGPKVKKAILVHHPHWMTENETTFIVTGWGETENAGENNYQIMREAELRYISRENCVKMIHTELTPDMFCLFGDGIKDTGRGDSGGGVLWNDQIVGITSHARFYNDAAMCAGAILSSYSVLTSAHCLDHNDDINLMAVVVGSQSLTDYRGQWAGIVKSVVHEEYNISVQFSCDVAVLFLSQKLEFSKTVQRVVIAHNNDWMKHQQDDFLVSGWGRTSYNGDVSPVLLMTKLHYIDREKCERLNGIKLSPDIFCLYGSGKSDACKGDSGGGVMWKGMLVGLTSHGNGGCSVIDKPTMFANIWYLRNWIEKQVNEFVRSDCVNTSSEKHMKLKIKKLIRIKGF
ncbi:trypsin-5-like [Plodia interpunctella]|uniref:trypsin-5-like n=1 Tax=Plodia interpunctella TaxID=58824 RepID=UPI0023684A88|nr:trypsin-5-like [Plodia interpunctella]